MTQGEIYTALNPDWWVSQTSPWNTEFMSTIINYTDNNGNAGEYVSSAPYQTNGLNAGVGAYTNDLTDFVNNLRLAASYYLASRNVSSIKAPSTTPYVFGAQE